MAGKQKRPEESSAPKRRLHVYFTGQVQGVGFRFTAATLAEGFAVTGWVRNLYDGRVELLAEGTEREAENYLTELTRTMGGYIQNVQRTWETPSGAWDEFHVAPSE